MSKNMYSLANVAWQLEKEKKTDKVKCKREIEFIQTSSVVKSRLVTKSNRHFILLYHSTFAKLY